MLRRMLLIGITIMYAIAAYATDNQSSPSTQATTHEADTLGNSLEHMMDTCKETGYNLFLKTADTVRWSRMIDITSSCLTGNTLLGVTLFGAGYFWGWRPYRHHDWVARLLNKLNSDLSHIGDIAWIDCNSVYPSTPVKKIITIVNKKIAGAWSNPNLKTNTTQKSTLDLFPHMSYNDITYALNELDSWLTNNNEEIGNIFELEPKNNNKQNAPQNDDEITKLRNNIKQIRNELTCNDNESYGHKIKRWFRYSNWYLNTFSGGILTWERIASCLGSYAVWYTVTYADKYGIPDNV